MVCFAANSADHYQGFYFKAGAGPTLSEDVELREFLDEPVGGAEIEFDPGVRFDVGVGYLWCPWFSTEFETGFMWNSAKKVAGAFNNELSISQVPFLGNLVFKLPNNSPFTPFVGVGGGGTISVLSADEFIFGSTLFDGTESDVTYAYQGYAGVRYALNQNMGLSLAYKYFATGKPEWSPDVLIGTFGDISTEEMRTHSVMLTFSFRF